MRQTGFRGRVKKSGGSLDIFVQLMYSVPVQIGEDK
jgi:hypothetical protein